MYSRISPFKNYPYRWRLLKNKTLFLTTAFYKDMYTMQKIILSAALVSTLFLGSACNKTKSQGTIAITQIAPHPSLDNIRKGIEDVLKEKAKDYKIDFQNAQGNTGLSVQIAQKFVHSQPKVIIPITTTSTLSVYKVAEPLNIPVVFSGVTDPVHVNLCSVDLNPIKGITGVRDYMEPSRQIAFLKDLFKGKNYTRIGTLYTVGESNSVAQVEQFEKALIGTEFSLKKIPIHQTSDVGQATQKIISDVDFILIFNDNTVVSGMPQILKIAKEVNIPVIATDPESVELGAVAALAFDQYAMGRQTGEMAIKVINGEKPEGLTIETASVLCVYLNQASAKQFELAPLQNTQMNIITLGEKT